MAKIFYIFNLLLLIFVVASTPVSASYTNNKDSVTRWYKVYWKGLHVADFTASAEDTKLTAKIETYGLVYLISKYVSLSSGTVSLKNGEYVPLNFTSEFIQRNRNKKVDLRYEKSGSLLTEEVNPPDSRSKRPAVPEKLKKGAVDPVAAAFKARELIKKSLKDNNKSFSFPIYEGRRLSNLKFEILGRTIEKINGTRYPVVKIKMTRSAIAGYTASELKRMKQEEPVMTISLNDDKNLFPLKAEATAPAGTALIVYEKECFGSINDCH